MIESKLLKTVIVISVACVSVIGIVFAQNVQGGPVGSIKFAKNVGNGAIVRVDFDGGAQLELKGDKTKLREFIQKGGISGKSDDAIQITLQAEDVGVPGLTQAIFRAPAEQARHFNYCFNVQPTGLAQHQRDQVRIYISDIAKNKYELPLQITARMFQCGEKRGPINDFFVGMRDFFVNLGKPSPAQEFTKVKKLFMEKREYLFDSLSFFGFDDVDRWLYLTTAKSDFLIGNIRMGDLDLGESVWVTLLEDVNEQSFLFAFDADLKLFRIKKIDDLKIKFDNTTLEAWLTRTKVQILYQK